MSNLKIGILHYRKNYYTYQRTIVNQVPGCDYIGMHDMYSYLRSGAFRLRRLVGKKRINSFNLNNLFQDFGLNQVDLLHLFNGVNLSAHHKWLTTFETIVPRLTSTLESREADGLTLTDFSGLNGRCLKALAATSCKALLPLSQNARDAQISLMRHAPAELAEAIAAKMRVLHPPQNTLIHQFSEKPRRADGKIRFIFVGYAFFRKGGREILQAFEKLVREEHLPIELTLISSISPKDYTSTITLEDIQAAKDRITQNRDWIDYYPELTNDLVIQKMMQSDVGLLPTYADTYGLSVIEFQASGCPVITTNIRAIPEMNTPDTGWLIDVPKDALGEALYRTAAERVTLSEQITRGLLRSVREICQHPELVAHKGQAALEKVIRDHDPARYSETLSQIYQNALK
jgi:glycosyltransferase involved in cell wall biosynthesis